MGGFWVSNFQRSDSHYSGLCCWVTFWQNLKDWQLHMYLLSLKTTTIYYFVNLQSFGKESHKNNSCLNLTQDSNSESYDSPLIDLHLIFEKLSLKNQVERTWFFVYFELNFYCLCKIQVWNRLKIKFVHFDFSNLIFQKSSADQ